VYEAASKQAAAFHTSESVDRKPATDCNGSDLRSSSDVLPLHEYPIHSAVDSRLKPGPAESEHSLAPCLPNPIGIRVRACFFPYGLVKVFRKQVRISSLVTAANSPVLLVGLGS
jgi:hypothetical protein